MAKAGWRIALVLAIVLTSLWPALLASPSTAEAQGDPRFFGQTGYRIDNDAFYDYFNRRGGIQSFGYPVSRTFRLQGFTVQFFQRAVMQLAPDGSARLLNLLDPGLLNYTTFNNAVVPAHDPALVAKAPAPGSPSYATGILDYVRQNAPDTWNGKPVSFGSTFFSLPNDAALELWGVPTSQPAYDPANQSFVYQRFQRGIMHYDAGCNCTQAILLADYLKSIITGVNLPADLDAQAQASPYYKQYNNAQPNGLNRPAQLPTTNMQFAFDPQ